MILQALSSYYERLRKDPDEDVPEPGFSKEKIHFELVLSPDGKLRQVNNIQVPTPKGKKLIPNIMSVPEPDKTRRGLNIAANFAWDNTGYALGADSQDKPERLRAKFTAFLTLAHEVGDSVNDVGMRAVLAFLDAWNPEDAPQLDHWDELAGQNVVFRIDGETQRVHESTAVRAAWLSRQNTSEAEGEAICLISGERGPVARLHPPIKGVYGQKNIGPLVGLNDNAYWSYGREQSFNAPTSERAAFAYATALNHLLAGSRQKVQVGNATGIFWSEKPSQAETLFSAFLDIKEESEDAHDTDLIQRLHELLEAVRDGKEPPLWGDEPKTPFYIMGLSPNAARLSVRFWHVSTVAAMAERLGQHFLDLKIEKAFPKNPSFPSLWQLLIEIAPLRKTENIPSTLGGELMRAVITGSAYPQSLLTRVIGRIRAEQDVSYLKAALIKACFNRSSRLANKKEDVTVALDPTCENIGYLLGRLFAVLEKAQQDALPGINATIKDRFFGAASATPRAVFPRLVRLAQHHISKAEYGHVADRLLAKVSEKIDACGVGFPAHLNLENQGMFALGYYHQRNDNYRKNEDKLDPIKEN